MEAEIGGASMIHAFYFSEQFSDSSRIIIASGVQVIGGCNGSVGIRRCEHLVNANRMSP